MTKVAGIDWAPVNIPFERRMQTLAVIHFVFIFIVFPVFCVVVPLYIALYTSYWWLTLIYAVWFIYDQEKPRRGSRPAKWMRNASIWRHFANYFPITLIKTAELPPEKNYIIGSHPHGILSAAAFAHLCTEGTNFSEKFPGITASLLTLVGQFWFPLRREYAMFSGAVESSSDSLTWLLNNPGKGRAVGIVLGGAEEVLDAHPDCYDLNLSKRRGFVKFALRHGADLVPMYHFGENNVYHQVSNARGSKLRAVQVFFKSYMGFSPPIFQGRGIFNYTFGLLPFRSPINTVLGAPIHVDKVDEPNERQISELHEKYCTALTKLFDDHKTKYGVPESATLSIY